MDEKPTEWIGALTAPAYVGWYEVEHVDGSISRYWRGPIWWALWPPSFGIGGDLAGTPGVRWRGLRKPTPGARYQATASARDHGVAYRILLAGR